MWEGLWERGLEVRVFSYGVLFLFPSTDRILGVLGRCSRRFESGRGYQVLLYTEPGWGEPIPQCLSP